MVKNLPAHVENTGSTLASQRSPGKKMATHPSILAWEIPWKEETGGKTVHEVEKESDIT